MNIKTATKFFMWCTIINFGFLILWSLIFFASMDRMYELHVLFFPIAKETYYALMFGLIGYYKLCVFLFNLIPYVALRILQKQNN